MKVVEALPTEAWRALLKREPVKRDTESRPALMETPAEMAQRLREKR